MEGCGRRRATARRVRDIFRPRHTPPLLASRTSPLVQTAPPSLPATQFAVMETPATVAAAYGVPLTAPNLGAMSGGLSPEGFLYGSSMVRARWVDLGPGGPGA
jgi:hypothetical protein